MRSRKVHDQLEPVDFSTGEHVWLRRSSSFRLRRRGDDAHAAE
jgi:hypothetical protein